MPLFWALQMPLYAEVLQKQPFQQLFQTSFSFLHPEAFLREKVKSHQLEAYSLFSPAPGKNY